MMTWNHRVMRYADGSLGIHEVFYNDDGNPVSWTEEAIGVAGDNLEELREELTHMLRALDKPILDYK